MWRTSIGERVITGAEGDLIRALVESTSCVIQEFTGYEGCHKFGVTLFDQLDTLQQLALLADVAEALLMPSEECPALTAINEAAIAAIYSQLRTELAVEVDTWHEIAECGLDGYRWRKLTIAALDQAVPCPPDCLCETHLRVDSTDHDEWSTAAEMLEDVVLWDADFEDFADFADLPPTVSIAAKNRYDIPEDYFLAIPPDPREGDLNGILRRLRHLTREAAEQSDRRT